MTGVEILATEEVATEFAFNWSVFWIYFGIIFGALIIIGIMLSLLYDGSWLYLLVCVFVGIILGSFMAYIFGNDNSIPIAYETQYKVTISDEVPMNDFLEKYEIIDQEGKIYTIRER